MMSALLLSKAERIRFTEWLEFQAETNSKMIRQMEKLSILSPMIQREKSNRAAFLGVATYLRNIETMEINNGTCG